MDKPKIEAIKVLGCAEDYSAQTFTYVAKIQRDNEWKTIGETFIFRRKLGIENFFKTKNIIGLAKLINDFEKCSVYLTDLEILYIILHIYKHSQYDIREISDFLIREITEREYK